MCLFCLGLLSAFFVSLIRTTKRLSTTAHCEDLRDKYFGLRAPQMIGNHIAVASACRSMHELHWLPLARAYILTVLADRNFVEEFPWTSPAVPKTLTFTFAQSKDSKHVVSGFSRSLAWAKVEGHLAEAVISVLRGKEVRRGDVLQIVCEPQSGNVTVRLTGADGNLFDERRVEEADNLISGLHRLFLTEERYKHMFARLCKSSMDREREMITPDSCAPYMQ